MIATIDYTFFPKGGNETCGLKSVWSGATDRARRGLETPATGLIVTDSGEVFNREPLAFSREQSSSDSFGQGRGARNRVCFFKEWHVDFLGWPKKVVRYVVADGCHA